VLYVCSNPVAELPQQCRSGHWLLDQFQSQGGRDTLLGSRRYSNFSCSGLRGYTIPLRSPRQHETLLYQNNHQNTKGKVLGVGWMERDTHSQLGFFSGERLYILIELPIDTRYLWQSGMSFPGTNSRRKPVKPQDSGMIVRCESLPRDNILNSGWELSRLHCFSRPDFFQT